MRDYVPPGVSPFDSDRPADERRLFDIVDAMRHYALAPDQRVHLADELRAAVDNIKDFGETNIRPFFEIDHANERGPAVAKLVRTLHELLTSKKLNDRLAAIEAFKALISTANESMHARTQRTSNAIRVLFNTNVTDIATASAAASLVAALARLDSPMSVRAVEYALNNAISLIGSVTVEQPNPQLSMDRARAAMVITQLAAEEKVSNVIFCRQAAKLCRDMWKVCWDSHFSVRDCGVHALQAVLEITVTRSEASLAQRSLQEVVDTVRRTLSPETSPARPNLISQPHSNRAVAVVHGSMSVLGALLKSHITSQHMKPFSAELCNLVLPYQTCKQSLLRQTVALILPLLVALDRNLFATQFLDTVQASTLNLIRNKKFPAEERGRSLVAMAEIAEQMPENENSTLVSDMLQLCREELRQADPDDGQHQVPENAVILAISHLAKTPGCSPSFEKALSDGLLRRMFNTNFTNALVMAVDNIDRAVPASSEPIRLRLVHLIAATLKKRMPRREEDTAHAVPTEEELLSQRRTRMKSANRAVPRTRSFLSLEISRKTSPQTQARPGPLRRATLNAQADVGFRAQADAREYFLPAPIFQELHRIDTSSDLASRPSVKTFSSLLKEDLMSSSLPNREYYLVPPERDLDSENDLNNSPCVALKAIVNYEFSDMQVQDFISFATEFVIGYVEYNRVKVRALAVAACAKLMVSAAKLWAGPMSARRLPKQLRRGIHSILAQLSSIAVADPSTDVRFVAIRSLNEPTFYPYLLQPEMLDKLFLCFYDESLAMRDTALTIAGRLSHDNPAHVLPSLRYQLMRFLTVLKCDGEHFTRDRRRATELLYTLVHSAPSLVPPYTTALIDAILLRLQEAHQSSDTSMALPILKAVAEMGGTMSRIDLRPFKKELVTLLVNSVLHVRSAGSRYKLAALRALAAFVQNTAQAIQPYLDHPQLLPELIELLQAETDTEVRLNAEILVGSLGAVDPDEHKHVTEIKYSKRMSALDKASASGSQSRSVFRRDTPGANVVLPWDMSGSRAVHSSTVSQVKLSHERKSNVVLNSAEAIASEPKRGDGNRSWGSATRTATLDTIAENQEPELEVTVALFELGGTKLMNRITGYCPKWAESEMLKDSLIARLEHPFTGSRDYFPSVALDALHKIIGNPRLRVQHREACQAIVNILKSTGPRCVNFLPSVVPRIQWLLAQSLSKNSRKGTRFGQLEQHLMQRLADIVATAGSTYLPYTFDTVLLAWTFLKTTKQSPGCVTSICSLLLRLRVAIGDEFKPVIPTVLPPLLGALAQDRSCNAAISRAVLRTLESFGKLLGTYRDIVLLTLSEVTSTSTNFPVRAETLRTLIRIVSSQQSVEVLSGVMHPLMKILAGAKDRTYSRATWKQQDVEAISQESRLEWLHDENLAVLAASALTEMGARASQRFNVFVPVIAKALRASDVRRSNKLLYRALKACLMRRDADVVAELLGDDQETGFGSLPVLPDVDMEEGEFSISQDVLGRIQGLAPPVRGGALQGQPSLPQGTKPTQHAFPHVVEHELVRKWEVNHNFTSQDWINWFESVKTVMFEQSGAPAFRACGRISDSYPAFIRELFNAAFLSCWITGLSSQTKTRICDSLDVAMSSETIPINILQAILFLFEFMDHAERPLPAATERLARTACRCGAFAKAVRYREQDYVQHSDAKEQLKEDVFGEDGLLEIYKKLGQTESAVGTCHHYRKRSGESLREEWLEKLGRWDDALESYGKTPLFLDDNGHRDESTVTPSNLLYADKDRWRALLGTLRCLDELGEWHKMDKLLQKAKKECNGNTDALRQLALEGKGASVAFDLGQLNEFEEWVRVLQPDTYLGCYYNTLLMVKLGKENPAYLDRAQEFLHQARCKLDLQLTACVSEAYPRAYVHVVNAQLLVELEEMINFLRLSRSDSDAFGKRRLDAVWAQRLKGCKQDRVTWYKLLMIRALVQRPVDVKDQWLDFISMYWKNNRLPWAGEALRMLVSSCRQDPREWRGAKRTPRVSSDNIPSVGNWGRKFLMSIGELEVRFACVKHIWNVGNHAEAYETLKACRQEYLNETGHKVHFRDVNEYEAAMSGDPHHNRLAGEVFLKLSDWGETLLGETSDADIGSEDPLQFAQQAVTICPSWSEAWHHWGTLNVVRFETLMKTKSVQEKPQRFAKKRRWQTPDDIPELAHGEVGRIYFEQAVRGLFNAIDLDACNPRLEDSLKVLTFWFNYGGYASAHTIFDECFKRTNITMWLEVVPQIVARLYSPFPAVQRGVKALLTRIGKEHPQVAVYPLTVAKGAIGEGLVKRRRTAVDILEELSRHHPEIVDQSALVAGELVRAAILWVERWFEKLEEASKLYFVEHNLDEMLETLLPLHQELEAGAETVHEEDFIREFGQGLNEAGELMRRFQAGHKSRDPEQVEAVGNCLITAWHHYHEVFRKIQRVQNSMVILELAKVSKRLHEAHDLVLAIPGTYDPNHKDDVVGIRCFGAQLTVLQSKQRPRRLSMIGSDGHEYEFLLKGHEDLRQDERVMQVFRLVNKIFAKSTQRAILTGVEMKTYKVVSLSSNVGLIEWVPECDTMHALVKEYREARKIMPNVEHKVMLRLAAEPDRLPLLHKVDLFELMLQQTVSVDIAKVLWLQSRSSEIWLSTRNTYAKSLATTSMTGYLLGLGDRHPSNLMIERSTGRVMHIDFGDCFEVAMKREKFPEKVPFRLTRMLVQALEPCGVDGYFRHTAEATMEVLRQKNPTESLMAMMEAFVYDPLLRWKLIGPEELDQIKKENKPVESGAGVGTPKSRMSGNMSQMVRPNSQEGIVRSLHETGSLAASVRIRERQEKSSRAAARAALPTESRPGAIPLPGALGQVMDDKEEVEIDPADLQTPNEEARSRQRRAFRDGEHFNDERIIDLSNDRARCALERFETKLYGTDFDPDVELSVPDQVDRLIWEARNIENLCALFMGWCAFW